MNSIKTAVLLFAFALVGGITFAAVPSFNDSFGNYLTDTTPDRYGRVETVFDIGIDRNISLMDNVKRLFYPSSVAITDADGNVIEA